MTGRNERPKSQETIDSAAASSLIQLSTRTTTYESSESHVLVSHADELRTRLEEVAQASSNAEAAHAYDIGVVAALSAMKTYWDTRGDNKYTSLAEKRIFRREAERLDQLLVQGRGEMLKSDKVLAANLAEKTRLAEQLGRPDSEIHEVHADNSPEENPPAAFPAAKEHTGFVRGRLWGTARFHTTNRRSPE